MTYALCSSDGRSGSTTGYLVKLSSHRGQCPSSEALAAGRPIVRNTCHCGVDRDACAETAGETLTACRVMWVLGRRAWTGRRAVGGPHEVELVGDGDEISRSPTV